MPAAAPAAPPAAAPAAPAPAAPAAPPAPRQPEAPESEWLEEAGADLDAMDRGEAVPERGAYVPPKKPEKKPDDDVPPQPDPKVVKKPDAPPKPEDKAPIDEAKMTVPQLRKNRDELKARIAKELEPEIQKLRTQVSELEKKAPADVKPFEEKLATAQKRIADQEALIQHLAYERSAEFNDNYAKPYQERWAEAVRNMAEYKVEMPDGSTRQASEKDLVALGQMSLGDRRNAANAMFGDSADDVMAEVRDVVKLSQAQENALQQHAQKAAKFAEESKTKAAEQSRLREQNWQTNNQSLAEKYPKWFAPDPEDTEGNSLLKKGFAVADLLFAPTTLDDAARQLLPKSFLTDLEANKGRLSPEAQTKLDAMIRNKAAGFDRLSLRVKSLSKELEEANAKLAQYEESEPGTGGDAPTGGGPVGDYQAEYEAEIDKLDKR